MLLVQTPIDKITIPLSPIAKGRLKGHDAGFQIRTKRQRKISGKQEYGFPKTFSTSRRTNFSAKLMGILAEILFQTNYFALW